MKAPTTFRSSGTYADGVGAIALTFVYNREIERPSRKTGALYITNFD